MTLSRHTALAPGKGPERRTRLPRGTKPIPTFGRRRKSERQERRDVVAAVLARDGGCQATAMHPGQPCRGPLDAHEVIPRSAWARGYLVESNVLIVCRLAHELIGTEVERAHALGFHGFSWERPSE